MSLIIQLNVSLPDSHKILWIAVTEKSAFYIRGYSSHGEWCYPGLPPTHHHHGAPALNQIGTYALPNPSILAL
jgi:hypothetical protein